MLILRSRVRRSTAAPGERDAGRPILLATLGVPLEAAAAEFAVDSAVEAGQPLIVANVVEIILGPCAVVLGYGDLEDTPETAASLAQPAELAASLGVHVERLRVKTPHPIDAVLQLATERRAGLLVFGADRTCLRARTYRRAERAIRKRASCLVWLPG